LKTGTEIHDAVYYDENAKNGSGYFRKTNNAGGIEGGMSNGEPILIRAVMKPVPTTMKGIKTVDIRTKKAVLSAKERADVCAVNAAAVVSEGLLALTLMSAILRVTGGDNMETIKRRYYE
jgi:chorismate synthase